MSRWPTQVRWFDRLENCRCGKHAQGVLRGSQNESYGTACATCARKALADAERARSEFAAAKAFLTGEA